jgi:hypothetical protein
MTVSLSGLDLSFLRKDNPSACAPGRYRIDPETGEAIPAHVHARKYHIEKKRGDVAVPYFMPDLDAIYGGPWKSVVDGCELSSRSNRAEHNKRNGVVDVGDTFWSADGDDIKRTEEIMGYDKSLIGDPSFTWKDRS